LPQIRAATYVARVLPFAEPPALHVLGLTLEAFGILVVTGVLVALARGRVLARREGLAGGELLRAAGWAVIAGFAAARAGQVLFLRPALLAEHGWRAFLDPQAGLSSSFGFLGGALAALAFLHARRLPRLRMLDVLVEALIVGWAFGRLGCALVHDHPGTRTGFPLAVRFPDGPRHDLGLYEWLFTVAVLLPAVAWIRRRRSAPGARLAAACLLYGPARFALDFLRARDLPAADPRFAGLTAAQWGSLLLIAIGLALWRRSRAAGRGERGS
jgi:phosphatidylglycerol:prolipoprotein diacylglycerol transferase